MIKQFRERIEKKIGYKVENADIFKAIDMAKSDIVINNLVLGVDVTAKQFEEVVSRCLKVLNGKYQVKGGI